MNILGMKQSELARRIQEIEDELDDDVLTEVQRVKYERVLAKFKEWYDE